METNSSLNEPITVNENYWHKFHPIHPYWHYAYAILFSIIDWPFKFCIEFISIKLSSQVKY